jgi:hypothetical protein
MYHVLNKKNVLFELRRFYRQSVSFAPLLRFSVSPFRSFSFPRFSDSPSRNISPLRFSVSPFLRFFIYTALIRLIAILWILLPTFAAAGESRNKPTNDFETVIKTLVAFGDRTTGTPGARSAAAYIKGRFNQLGLESIDSHWFSVPVVRHGKSTLTVMDQNVSFPLHPINANAITPQTVSPPGLEGPLIYVGQGELHHFNGKRINGAIILMELDSGVPKL